MSIESLRIFTAIFPRISMFNHSCDPNIRNRFDNTELLIFARRAINEGDEIFNCYGPNSKLNLRQERQELLNQQYEFECDCLSCKGSGDEDYVSLLFHSAVLYKLTIRKHISSSTLTSICVLAEQMFSLSINKIFGGEIVQRIVLPRK